MRITCVAALAAMFAGGAVAAEFDDNLQRSFKAQKGGKLTFNTEYGSIDVRSGDVSGVQLTVERRVEARDKAEADEIFRDLDFKVEETGSDARVEAFFKNGWKPSSEVTRRGNRICRNGRCLSYADKLKRYNFRLTVPRDFNVDLNTSGGSVGVADLNGSVAAKTSGGSLSFGRITGPVNGSTSGGSVSIAGTNGPVNVKTSGGSISIGDAAGEVNAETSGGSISIGQVKARVHARTSGGSIDVKGAVGDIDAVTSGGNIRAVFLSEPKASCRLTTSGGNVSVQLPDHAKFDVDASTSGGSVSSDFPGPAPDPKRRNYLKGSINGGGPLLQLRTSGGSIHLRTNSKSI